MLFLFFLFRVILVALGEDLTTSFDGLPDDCGAGQCDISLRQLRGEVKLQQDLDMRRQQENAEDARHAQTVEAILDVYFKDINMTGHRINKAVQLDDTWSVCAGVNWTQEALEYGSTGKLQEMRKTLGIDEFCGKYKDDVTCLAMEAAVLASTEMVLKGLSPRFANSAVSEYGRLPSWVEGSVERPARRVMPPRANVSNGQGVVGYGICSVIRTVLTGSPNQMGTGTCGWVASLGALSWAAPAQAIKMGMRLFWTGSMLQSIKTCANIYDLQPGLVPLTKERDTSSEARLYCYKDCPTEEEWKPILSGGLTSMWIYALMSSFIEHPLGCPTPSAISIQYPDIKHEEPDVFQRWDEIEGTSPETAVAVCQNLINPNCEFLDVNASQDREAALAQACDTIARNGVVLTMVDGDVLQGASPDRSQPGISIGNSIATFGVGELVNHATYLQSCDPEADTYAIWTWGGPVYLTKLNLIGSKTSPGMLLFYMVLAEAVHMFDD